MRKTKDLTPYMVEEFIKAVDQLESVDDLIFEFKEFERLLHFSRTYSNF